MGQETMTDYYQTFNDYYWPRRHMLFLKNKHDYNLQQILTTRAFLVHSTDWLKQTSTFVTFKHFQDQRLENHSVKNLEMCKD